VLAGERTVGYAFVNSDWVNSTGYSGKPIEILVGLSTDGKIAGARLMDHHEPIVLIGIPPERIANFIKGYVGRDVLQIATNAPSARPEVDIVSGATVTVAVIADSMIRSAIRVARTVKVGGVSAAAAAAPAREIDPAHSAPEDWTGMLGDGSVRRLSLSVGEVTDAFRRAGNNEAAANPEAADPAATFIDLYAGLVSVPAIGKRLHVSWAKTDLLHYSRVSSPANRRSWSPATASTHSRDRDTSGEESSIVLKSFRATPQSASGIARIRVLGDFKSAARPSFTRPIYFASPRARRWTRRDRGGYSCWFNAAMARAIKRS
jgi:hypothetical protein